jgi:putative transposase
MRYPASEKAGDHSARRAVAPAGAKQTLDKLGIPRPTFYRWYDRFLTHGVEGLEDRKPQRHHGCGTAFPTISETVSSTIALDQTELSPRELAVTFTDTRKLFCVRSFGLPPAQGAGSDHQSPAFIVIKAADEFKDKTTRRTSCGRPTSPIVRLVPDGPGCI